MAANRRGSERVLRSGHLVGLFLAVVVLCSVFYTLGFVMGRSQEASTIRSATVEDTRTVTAAPVRATPASLPAASGSQDAANNGTDGEWDFTANGSAQPVGLTPAGDMVKSVVPSAPKENLNPAPQPSGPMPTPARSVKTSSADAAEAAGLSRYAQPRIPRGAVVLQVAALNSESDALAMADVLQKKQFPAYVTTPTTDRYFRVQIGPYADMQSARLARASLDHAGFKSIIKR